MNFTKQLNEYLTIISCSAKELANTSKLSKATISRYLNGTRIPTNPSPELEKLIQGLATLAQDYQINTLNKEIITKNFNVILKPYDFELIIKNFNTLVSTLKINMSEFSKNLGFDASYLSKIRQGQRKPADLKMFIEAIGTYITNNYHDNDSKRIISSLNGFPLHKINTKEEYLLSINSWLCSNTQTKELNNDITHFLSKLNNFDLNEYIKVLHFDQLKVPTLTFTLKKSKNYYGLTEMKQGELDFFKATILAKNNEKVFMCSDMPMDDMAKDLEFGKKWMYGLALMLKKGIHLDIIHNLDRPFKEMMIGLESWIPLYMTGQVSPYYLNHSPNSTYCHFNYVSNSVALTGECIKGYHNQGKYYLTNNKKEINYYEEKAQCLLKKAHPLMNIYRYQEQKPFNAFLVSIAQTSNHLQKISPFLPIYTMPESLLLTILKRNNLQTNDIKQILAFTKKEKERMQNILINSSFQESLIKISKKEFTTNPLFLELSYLFHSAKIIYTYEEYLKHYQHTLKYIKDNNNYSLSIIKNFAFQNMQILINQNKWVMLSKVNGPAIHFVITHPKLCKAIENFTVPIIE